VVGDEVRDRRGNLVAIGACLRECGRDVVGHVTRPALSGIESNDALAIVFFVLWIVAYFWLLQE
jgi:hypothetical protein